MKPFVKGLCVALVSWVVLHAAAAQEAVRLRYLPSKDDLIIRKVTKFKQNQNLMGKELKNEATNTEVSVWNVAEVKDNLEIKTQAKSLLAKMNFSGLGEYTFDSRKNDNEKGSALGSALTPLYERLANANMTVTITPLGKAVKLEGYKELIGDLAKDNPIIAQFTAGGSEEAAMLGMSDVFPTFSADPVSPGQRWETPFEIRLDKFCNAKGKKTYVYEGSGEVGKRKTAKISIFQELSFDLNLDMGGVKVTGNMSITESKGTLHFDPAKGHLISMTNEYKLGGNLNVSAGGKDIPVVVDQTQQVTIELLEKLPE